MAAVRSILRWVLGWFGSPTVTTMLGYVTVSDALACDVTVGDALAARVSASDALAGDVAIDLVPPI